MKRALVLTMLLLFIGGVVYLLMQTGDEERGRRGPLGENDAAKAGLADAGDADANAGAAAKTDGARDDDPNRIDGPKIFVRGRVVANGRAVPNAKVEVLRAPPYYESSYVRWARRGTATDAIRIAVVDADSGGRFEAGFARRTTAVFRATADGHAPASVRVILPRTGDLDEVTLTLGKAHALTGIVVNESNEPVAGATIQLRDTDRARAITTVTTQTGDDGRFELADLAGKSFEMTATAPGYGVLRRWINVAAIQDTRIVLGRAGVIEGRVTRHDGTAVEGARITITTNDEVELSATGVDQATTDADGRYRMEAVRPGFIARIELEHPVLGFLNTQRDLQLPVATVKAGETLVQDLELPVALVVNGVAVHAETGAPAGGAHVTLLKMNNQYRSLAEAAFTVADDQGRFTFAFVTAGSYAIEAKTQSAARLVTRFTQQNQRGITHDFFTDGTKGPDEQRIELVPVGAVRGRVVGIHGAKPTGFNVHVVAPTGQLTGDLDDLLNFQFTHVPVMPEAAVQSWNPQLKSEPFAVEAGKTANVKLDARAGRAFTGRVVDAEGRPIKGAKVAAIQSTHMRWQLQQFLNYGSWGGTLTDAQGRFRYQIQQWMAKDAHKHKWSVLAKHDGYVIAEVGNVKVPEGGEPPEVEITLRRGGAVSGRVEREGGAPVAGMPVYLHPIKKKSMPNDRRQRLQANSKSDGTFEIDGVGDGTYRLTATNPKGTVEPREVSAGVSGLQLVMRETASIRGVLVDEDGHPLAQQAARIYAIIPTEKGERKHAGFMREGGQFQINNLEPGAYAIQVEPGRNTTASFKEKRTEPVQAGTEGVRIEVEPGPRIRGRVRGPGGKALVGVAVIAMPLKAKPGRTMASPSGDYAMVGGGGARPFAVTNGEGEFEIALNDDKEVELLAMKPGLQVETTRAAPGDTGVTMRLKAGALLEVQILKPDGTPYVGWCNVHPKDPQLAQQLQDWQRRGGQSWMNLGGWSLMQGQSNRKGVFKLAGLVPGEYQLWINQQEGVLEDNVVQTGGGRKTIRLVVPFTVTGRVTDENGNPVAMPAGQLPYVMAHKGTRHLQGAQATVDGTFEITGLPAGEVTLQTWARGYQPASVNVEAGATDVHLVLKPAKPPKPKR